MSSRLDSEDRATLPAWVRKRLGLGPGDRVDFVIDARGEVRLVPINRPVTALMPCPEGPVALDVMEEVIGRGMNDGGHG